MRRSALILYTHLIISGVLGEILFMYFGKDTFLDRKKPAGKSIVESTYRFNKSFITYSTFTR